LPCREKEEKEDKEYYETRTKLEYHFDSDMDVGKWLGDNISWRAVSPS
jgi:hypothetical protein